MAAMRRKIMIFKSKQFQLGLALALGIIVFFLPRPEGTQFKITGDQGRLVLQNVSPHFTLVPAEKEKANEYIVEAIYPKSSECTAQFLRDQAAQLNMEGVEVDYVNGLSPKGKRFLAVLVVLIFLFVAEPIPLEITAICIGVFLVVMGISDVKEAWAPYMHPVVVFIMCCLIFAISLDKAQITKRLGHFIVKKAGTSVTKFTFIIAVSLGMSSSFMHDAAACAIGIMIMIPLMKAAGIEPHTKTAKFMMLSLPFACSCGGMGSLIGGGRCMVAAAFLKEYTGLEISFFDWIVYAMPAAIICVPAAVAIVYLVFRPDPKYQLPAFDEAIGPWTALEKKTLIIIGITFALWLTKGIHGIDYSITGMLGVGALVLFGILKWEDINDNLEWGTALFIRAVYFRRRHFPGSGHGLLGSGHLFCQPVFPDGSGRGMAPAVCRRRCFRGAGYQCHGQRGRRGPDPADCDSNGPAGRGRSHDYCPVSGNGHFICHAFGNWVSAQRHRIQLSIFQGCGSYQSRPCCHPDFVDHFSVSGRHLVENIGAGVMDEGVPDVDFLQKPNV